MSLNFKTLKLRIVGATKIYATVRDTQRVSMLITAICDRHAYPIDHVKLCHNDKTLDSDKTFYHNGIRNSDVLVCKYYRRRRLL